MTESEWLACEDPARMLRWRQGGDPLLPPCPLPPLSDRKLRLFAYACAMLHHPPGSMQHRHYFEQYEKWSSHNKPDPGDQIAALWVSSSFTQHAKEKAVAFRCICSNPWRKVELPKTKRCKKCGWDGIGPNRKYCDRPQTFDGKVPHLWAEHYPWFTHNDGAVRKIAQVIYDKRNFDLMPMLADALEEAGCPSEIAYEGPLGTEWLCSKCERRVELKNTFEQGNLRQEYCCPACGWRDRHTGVKGTRTICEPHPILAHLRGPGPHCRGCWVLDLLLGRD